MKHIAAQILVLLLTQFSFSQTIASGPNRALQFNGSNDYIRLPSSSSLTSFGNQITVEAWVKVSAYGASGGAILASGNENEYAFSVYPDGKLGVTLVKVNPQVDAAFIGRSTLALNTWYHVAFTYDGSLESILINGIVDTSFSTSGTVSTSQYAENISIACYSASSHTYHSSFLSGILDEVRIWNIGRTPSQIQATMNSELTGTESGLMGYWKFNDDVLDGSPNGNNGTVFGSPVFVDGITFLQQYETDAHTRALYHLNEDAASIVRDSSGNGNHGVAVGATIVPGAMGNARSFNGFSDYIDLPETPFLVSFADQITVEALIKLGTIPAQSAHIVSSGNQNDYDLSILNSLKLTHHLYPFGDMQSRSTIPLNEWTHVAFTYDGAWRKIYINGILDTMMTQTGNIGGSPQTENVSIGAYLYNGVFTQFFNGLIDEVRISDTARFVFNAPIPVQLASFSAVVVNSRGHVNLRWMTLSETNNYGFEVQKSMTQTSQYQTIPNSFLAGHGTTLEPHHYAYVDTATHTGRWFYRLKQIDLDGTLHITEPISITITTSVAENAPSEFKLYQNHPNPFNPTTELRYQTSEVSFVSLRVFDLLGREVAKLVNEELPAGTYTRIFDATHLTSGVYFYRLQARPTDAGRGFVATRKMVLIQ